LEWDHALHHSVHPRCDCRRILFAVIARTANGIGRCRNPFSERQALAESFDIAAEQLESGVCRFLVDEYLRTAIASQPTSGRWANDFDKIIQTAYSPDTMMYAKNLRAIANALR
jgi:hypothetical protein